MEINFLHYILFIVLILYSFLKAVSYAIYEIKKENNKSGGIIIITFSIFCSILGIISLFFI